MKIEIIVIGDEVLLGQVENTNSGWIAHQLSGEGISVRWMTVVADDEEEILGAFQRAFQRADVALITGGLGPTHDDLTKPLIAKFFDLPIVFRNDILEEVRAIYSKRQMDFIETSRTQAEFPQGATVIRNVHGTAPGIWVERKGRIFAAMPGVPEEMRAMLRDFVLPKLVEKRRGRSTRFRTLHTIGILEALLYEKLDNREQVLKLARLAFLPSYSGVRLRLTVEAESNEAADARLDAAERLLRERIGDYIIGVGEDFTLAKGVGELLIREGKRLVLAESCTGGLLAKLVTDTPGSSQWFERSFVTYSNEAKQELLSVPPELIERHGAVSAEVAEAMADGALRNSRAQVAVSITGIAGPTGGTTEKPVGLLYIGYADARGAIHNRYNFTGERGDIRERSVAAALNLLMKQLAPKPGDDGPRLV